MAEDGRPSERGHCLLALPRALALFVVRVVLRPDRWFTADPYPPEAAEAPQLDCGHQPGGATHTCMHCRHTRCYACHYAHQAACHDQLMAVADGLGFQCSQPTTEPVSPAIVAGADLTPDHGDPDIAEAHALYAVYRAGEDLGGRRELSPLSEWTRGGWVPIHDWRILRTDKRWW